MKHRRKFILGLALVAAVGLAIAGCGESPVTAPDPVLTRGTPGTFASPQILTVSSDGTVGYTQTLTSTTRENLLASGSLSTQRWISSSAVIDGNKGGTVRAGRFSVFLPAGAFKGPATITVTMPDSTILICDLEISPLAANKFKYPAQLTADLSGLSVDPSAFTMYWFDTSKLQWVNLFDRSVSTSTGVTAYLDHFSVYAAGKAGW